MTVNKVQNIFTVLAHKKLSGIVTNLVMNSNNVKFYKELIVLLLDNGANKEELKEIIKDYKNSLTIEENEEQNRKYVYERFDLFDSNLNWNKDSGTIPVGTI